MTEAQIKFIPKGWWWKRFWPPERRKKKLAENILNWEYERTQKENLERLKREILINDFYTKHPPVF